PRFQPYLPIVAPIPVMSTVPLHDALPILDGILPVIGLVVARLERRVRQEGRERRHGFGHIPFYRHRSLGGEGRRGIDQFGQVLRSEEHTSELQSRENLVCRLLLEKEKEDS